jgi:hypothetical protein
MKSAEFSRTLPWRKVVRRTVEIDAATLERAYAGPVGLYELCFTFREELECGHGHSVPLPVGPAKRRCPFCGPQKAN